MQKLLVIQSSILGANSTSSKYADKLAQKIKGDKEVVVKDLNTHPVIALTSQTLTQLSDEKNLVTQQHNALIEEFDNASEVIICAPMYNFNIPVSLKAYFDALTKAGKTFKYNEQGQAIGLLKDKPVHVILSRGGQYKTHNITFVEDYLKLQLNFLGLTKINFIFIEGVAVGSDLDKQFNEQI